MTEAHRLSTDGVSKECVARQLGLDVNTVQRYLEFAEGTDDLDSAVLTVLASLAVPCVRPRGESWDLLSA